MKLKGTIIISIISLFERLSYYGVRAILALYILDSDLLNIGKTDTIAYYGYWPAFLVFAAIPFSLITDKYLGQRKSIYIGGFISLIGYMLLIVQSKYTLLISLLLILSGTSLVKPSATILIGRQFNKENKQRTLAYMIFFLGINIGAFLGSLGIGYVAEDYDWKYGFIIAAISTLTYLCIAYFLRAHIEENETNKLSNPNLKLTLNRTFLIIPLLVLIHIVFWKSHDLEIKELVVNLSNSDDTALLGFEMPKSMLQNLTFIWMIPLTIIVFIYWYVKGVTNTFKAISISMLISIVAIIATLALRKVQTNNLLEFATIPMVLYAFAEVIISPILTSFVTRISDIKFSNTIYSTFILLTYALGAGFVYVLQNEYHSYIAIAILTLTILGLKIFKDKIRKLTYELK